jgi:heavy metal translocating P-type ATPase
MSGSVNIEGPLVIDVVHVAAESQYAKIVALVREAQSSKAPLQRVADRYAVLFTPITIIVCAIAYVVSGDWDRVLAVLAIATPCPLILATPVAILGGMNRSARRQILIRNGGAIENLGAATALLLDKTGTITAGHPEVSRVIPAGTIDANELLRLAAAVEQGSGHLLARTLIAEAQRRDQVGVHAEQVVEYPGQGVEGLADGRRVAIGGRSFVIDRYGETSDVIDRFDVTSGNGASLRAYVVIDGAFAGAIDYADMMRPGISEFLRKLDEAGITHVMLLSGDRDESVGRAAMEAGISEWQGDMLPGDKVSVVKRLMERGEIVAMMGDGTNDAPALTTATIGIALASHGRGIATEAADVILLADDPTRLLDGIRISRRTMNIAKQSIRYGLGISAVGMAFAAAGMIPPMTGAILQEVVDLAVIVNALRASRAPMYGKG